MFSRFSLCSIRTSRFLSSSLPRSYATATPKGRPSPTIRSPKLTIQQSQQASRPVPAKILQARNKAAIAEQILNAGRDVIYKAPSHVGLLIAAWAVFSSGTMCCLYFVNSGFHDSEKMKERGLPWWVSPVYKGVMLFMGLCSGIFLAQSFSFISAIKIVKDGGAVKLLVSQRPWFPIWRHHKFLVEPNQLSIDRKVAFLAQQPELGRTQVAQQAALAREDGNFVKRMIVSPFLIMRKLFFHEGVLKVVIPTGKNGAKERWVRLDMDGMVSNNGKDLLDIATIRS